MCSCAEFKGDTESFPRGSKLYESQAIPDEVLASFLDTFEANGQAPLERENDYVCVTISGYILSGVAPYIYCNKLSTYCHDQRAVLTPHFRHRLYCSCSEQ